MITLRAETPGDVDAIHEITDKAFAEAPHASGTEAAIVRALRDAGTLTLSLVAEVDGVRVGHIAFSPVTVDGEPSDFYGLGPVSVLPVHQGTGIGSALIREGLDRIRSIGANGCVLLGNPAYYGRFGFVADGRFTYTEASAEYFQNLIFTDDGTHGEAAYHGAFAAT